MNHSSRARRGLAVTAVAALTVAGLGTTAAPAVAAPVDGVRLISPYNPGQDVGLGITSSYATFVAEVEDASTPVAFEYNPDPTAGPDDDGWTPMQDATSGPARAGLFVTTRWSPDEDLLGRDVAVRASVGDGATTVRSVKRVTLLDPGAQDPPVAVEIFNRQTTGVFRQPYADSRRTAAPIAITGITTESAGGAVSIAGWDTGAGAFAGRTNAAVTCIDKAGPGGPDGCDGLPFRSFRGTVDMDAFDAEVGDVVALGAERETDSVSTTELYRQTVRSAQADVDPETGVVTVAVDDQDNRQVAGAEVRVAATGALVGYTDALGEVTTGLDRGKVESYYVNTTDTDGFESSIDVISEPVTGTVSPPAKVRLRRSGTGNGPGADVVRVDGPASVAGRRVTFSKVRADGTRVKVTTRRLDDSGDAQARIDDRNGTGVSTYTVSLPASERFLAARTARLRLR